MGKLISIELFKIFSKPRTYIGFGAIIVIVLAIEFGILFEGDMMVGMIMQNIRERFIFEGNVINQYLVAYIILNTLWIHVPILVALVTGDLLAGEANSGTFRLILTRPVSRVQLVLAKFIAGWIYSVLLVVVMALLSIGLGLILFGPGDLVVITNKVNIFSSGDVLWRFAGAYAYGILSMTTVAALSFLLSALADNSIGPIIGTIALIIGITIISTIGVSLLGPVNRFLFTSYLPSWQLFFHTDDGLAKLGHAILIQGIYIIGFLGFTIWYFHKKDILS
ncbi:MAG: ABC transporter permease subunit [Bacteroidales bacterium]|nr:ABC transporter permease subunit [Bacteroidales bacterium]